MYRDVLEDLAEETGPVPDGRGHEAAVDVVEGLVMSPVVLDIVYFELYIRRDAAAVSYCLVQTHRVQRKTDSPGWMGLRSFPTTYKQLSYRCFRAFARFHTRASGYRSASKSQPCVYTHRRRIQTRLTHVNSPITGSRTDVQDALCILRKRRKEESSA